MRGPTGLKRRLERLQHPNHADTRGAVGARATPVQPAVRWRATRPAFRIQVSNENDRRIWFVARLL